MPQNEISKLEDMLEGKDTRPEVGLLFSNLKKNYLLFLYCWMSVMIIEVMRTTYTDFTTRASKSTDSKI